MKTSLQSSPAVISGISQSDVSVMGMDDAGMRQACQIFRDAIYSDKIRAVVREWSCNAIDEHIKFDIQKPIEIGFDDKEFFVRDFAQGLSEDGIRNIFGQYFRSTKSGSDDFIGGFGVGAKSGHCYADAFNVESFFQGEKTIYSCVLSADEDGASVGNIVKLHSEPTTESGLRVSIPIKGDDYQKFAEEMRRAKRSSTRGICTIVDGNRQDPTEKELLAEKDGLRMFKSLGSGQLLITMGGVEYGMNTDTATGGHKEFIIKEKGININKAIDIQIDVPVGFMDIPISREVIKPTLRSFATVANIKEFFQDHFAKQIEEATSKNFGQLLENYDGSLAAFSSKELTINYSFFMDKEIVHLFRNCDFIGASTEPLAKKGDKFLCGLLPQSWSASSKAMQITREYNKKHNVRVLAFNKRSFDVMSEENKKKVKEFAFFRSPQTFDTAGVKKTKIEKGKFVAREGGISTYFTALELHNLLHNTSHTEAEAQAYIADVSNIISKSHAKSFCFSGNKVQDYYIPSDKGQSAMCKLGYHIGFTQAIRTHLNGIDEAEEKIRQNNQKTYERHVLMGKFGSKIRSKNLKRLNQYAAQVTAIIDHKEKNGHTLTFKILKTMTGEYSRGMNFTRAEVRKLIKLEA